MGCSLPAPPNAPCAPLPSPAGETLEALWLQHLPSLRLKGEGAVAQARKLFDWHLANLEFANACE